MAAKSTSTSTPKARSCRKTKSKVIQLTPTLIHKHSRERGWKEFHEFADQLTDAEMRIAGHLKPLTYPSQQADVQEARRLLGESIAKCKVIPFPIGSKSRKEA